MYNAFSSDYDRFVNWHERLQGEMPFILDQLKASPGKPRVLDAACGTGMHAIALARQGFSAVGADLSAGMVNRARLNAKDASVDVPFLEAGFGALAPALGQAGLLEPRFEALLCLGNSLPHLLTLEALQAALADFAACLNPGGLLLVQNRNFDAVVAGHQRWMEPQSHREGEREWLFFRFYDFEPGGMLSFNILTLRREGAGAWQPQVATTPLRPLLQEELLRACSAAGFEALTCFGSLAGAVFDPATSGNLVLVGKLSGQGA